MTEEPFTAILVCFACEPGAGSEEGVGWQWAVAAAEVADAVMVLTTADGALHTRPVVEDLGLALEVVAVDLPRPLRRLFPRKLIFVYYVIWQVLAGRAIARIERSRTVHVAHHLTWASDSLPSAISWSRAPVRIWGPVGGSTRTSRGLYRYLSARGKLDQIVRDVVNSAIRRITGVRTARHATLVVGLNDDVARTYRSVGPPVAVRGNLGLPDEELDRAGRAQLAFAVPIDPPHRTAVFVGRLIPWKGLLLAVRALQHAVGWHLVVIGEGPDRARAEALAVTLGVADRLSFVGRLPRQQVLAALATVDALVMPSFHDSGPWSAGEASALGCPVVCLDAGGVALLAGSNAHVVPVGRGDRLEERLAAALDAITGRGPQDRRWSAEHLPAALDSWYRQPAHEAPDPSEALA